MSRSVAFTLKLYFFPLPVGISKPIRMPTERVITSSRARGMV